MEDKKESVEERLDLMERAINNLYEMILALKHHTGYKTQEEKSKSDERNFIGIKA